MKIKNVKSGSDLREFINIPRKIYKNHPQWVPKLFSDCKYELTKNPFWEHSEKELYIAYNNHNEPVGRIAGIIDHNFNEFQNEKTGFFGYFESINDKDTAHTLYKTVRKWLASRGMKIMRGPTNPSMNDEIGFLNSGFDVPPCLLMPYNPPYYTELAELCGFNPVKELYAYDMVVANAPLERLKRLSEIVYKRNKGLRVRKFNTKDFDNEIRKALHIYNAAWDKNWGFVPWTEKEFLSIAGRLKDFFLPDTTLAAEVDGKPIGMLIAVPDYNIVIKKMNGRLFPFGIFKFLYHQNKVKSLRLMIMGVLKEYRKRGIEGVMYYESIKNSIELGFKKCEFSWVLEDNFMTIKACEMVGAEIYKRYSMYETEL